MDLLETMNATRLSSYIDPGSMARGMKVWRDGGVRRVVEKDRGPTYFLLEGEVWGSAPEPYDVEVSADQVFLRGYCTCPVRANCKHVVAVVMAAREAETQKAHQPEWQRRLDGLLEEIDPPEPDPEPVGLGLRLELKDDMRARSPGPSLWLRPTRRNKSGKWTTARVGWRPYDQVYDAAQIAALRTISAAASGGGWYVGGASGPVAAHDVGTGLWAMLAAARDAGIELLGPDDMPVRLVHERATTALDLSRDTETGGGLVAHVVVEEQPDPDDAWMIDQLLIGDPAHTVASTYDDRSLRIARLLRPLGGRLRSMARRHDGLHVPAADEEEFLTGYLPRLQRQIGAVSSDGSVEVPEPPKPRLVLKVDWPSPATAEVGWRWRYGAGEHVEDLEPLEDSAVRRRHDERLIEEQLVGALTLPTARLLLTLSGALSSKQRIGPEQLLGLPPSLIEVRATGLVEIEASAPTPDFREAEGPAEIRFEAGGTVPETGSEDDEEHRDWLDLAVTLTVDGHPLPLASVLEAMTRGQDKVFLPGGLYVSMADPALTELADLVAEAADLSEREPGQLRVGSDDLGRWAQLEELGIVDEQAAAWVANARALTRVEELPPVEPVGLKHELRPYQLAGFRWLATLWQIGLGGVLADDMGLGKTLQALAVIGLARSQGAKPFLVVAPTSVVTAWVEQAEEHTPGLDVRAVTGLEKKRGRTLGELADGADVVVTSYSLMRMEAEHYRALEWGGLIVDEAQMVKNHKGATYEVVRRIDAPFRLAMTGTPFENRLLELWAVLSLAAPGIYPHPEHFVEQVARPVERRHDEKALARFRTRIKPFLLRRTKELVAADLPPKQEQVLHVSLGAQHRRIYDTHLQRERQKVLGLVEDFDRNRIAIFGALTRLRQLSLDPALVDEEHERVGSAKIDVLVEQLREVTGEGHRALVFSTFTGFLGRVRDRLAREGITTTYLDGGTTDRAGAIASFRAGEASVFLISLKAGGVGLTLTEADYVYVLDPWWNPAAEAQAVDRAHRIGQRKPVFVYRLIAEDTIEEKVRALAERKAGLFREVIDGGGSGSGVIDADDVRRLFA